MVAAANATEKHTASHAHVPTGNASSADWSSLLAAARLPPSYAALLDEEQVRPADLAEITQREGRAATADILKQVGITCADHRLRIAEAAQSRVACGDSS